MTYTKFFNLDRDKQERIINAALQVFASSGYEAASTNEIVKEAGISKGLLFHYFNNKRELFLYLYDYSLRVIREQIVDLIDFQERDVLARCRQIVLLTIELVRRHPQMSNFILIANEKASEPIKKELADRNQQLHALSYAKWFEDIDESRFRDGIDVQRALQLLIWFMEGYAAAHQRKHQMKEVNEIDYDTMLADFNAYIDLLKTSFYRGEGE